MLPLLRKVLLMTLLAAGSPAFAANLLVWGDSLSAGYGLRPTEAWPRLLAARLAAQQSPYVVVNESVSGETSAGGRTRLPAALARHKPKIVIIELGANDGLRGLPPKAMRDNLHAMVEAAKQAGAKVLVVGMRMPPNYGPDYTAQFEQAYRDVARGAQVRLVPFLMNGFAGRPDLFLADGVHPTAAAQPIILDTIWPELKPLL